MSTYSASKVDSQRSVPFKTGAWTTEEDELLAQFQSVHGNRWSIVAQHIPGRTGQQCAQRWRHKVNPGIRKEKWSLEEDHQLATLVAEHGNRWADIAKHIPGRTDQQCMGRWRRHLDPNIRKCQWLADEDESLQQLYKEYGPQWSNISKRLQGRTAQQCRARWFQLCPADGEAALFYPNRHPHGHRRDRHHDGPSIQASAKILLEQMSATGLERQATGLSQDSMHLPQSSEPAEESAPSSRRASRSQPGTPRSNSQRRSSRRIAASSDVAEQDAVGSDIEASAANPVVRTRSATVGSQASKVRRPRVRTMPADTIFLQPSEIPGFPCNWHWAEKRQRSGGRRSRQFPSQLTTLPHRTSPRPHPIQLLTGSAPPTIGKYEDDDTDEDQYLAAMALTEMAGRPAPFKPEALRSSLRKERLEQQEVAASVRFTGDDASAKDTCCTPAKPSPYLLWDGPTSSSSLARAEVVNAVEQTPSNFVMHTPTLNALAGSPLPAEPLFLTPASRTMLHSMAHDPAVRSFDLTCGLTPPSPEDASQVQENACATPAAAPTPISELRQDGVAVSCKRLKPEAEEHIKAAVAADKPFAARRLTFADDIEQREFAVRAMPPPPQPNAAPLLGTPTKRARAGLDPTEESSGQPCMSNSACASAGNRRLPDTPCLPTPKLGNVPSSSAQAEIPTCAKTQVGGSHATFQGPEQTRPPCLDVSAAVNEACVVTGVCAHSTSSTGKNSANSSSENHIDRGTPGNDFAVGADVISVGIRGKSDVIPSNRSHLYKSQLDHLLDAVFSSV